LQPETSEKRTGDERPERVMKDPRGLLKEKFFEVIKQLKFILTRFERNGNNFQNTFEYSQDI